MENVTSFEWFGLIFGSSCEPDPAAKRIAQFGCRIWLAARSENEAEPFERSYVLHTTVAVVQDVDGSRLYRTEDLQRVSGDQPRRGTLDDHAEWPELRAGLGCDL